MVHMAHDAIEKEMSDDMVQKNLVLEHEKIKLLSFHNEQASIINEIPKSIVTLKKRLGIDTCLIETVCCNLCFKLYDIEKSHAKDDLLEQHKSRQLTMRCSAEILKTFGITGPCQNYLFTKHKTKKSVGPKMNFVHQDIITWLGKNLQQPGYEDLLDSNIHKQLDPNTYDDIWSGEMWKTFKGNSGEIYTQSSGNLVFGLYVDWFNPYGSGPFSKSLKTGVILLFCYNLPVEIRYKPHNVFIYGLTPPPKEPTAIQLNNLLEPLITNLNKLWKGVLYSKTHKNPGGRTIKVALWPILGDLPAIRKVCGASSHSAKKFCGHCHLTSNNLWNIEKESWVIKEDEQQISRANEWLNAKTLNEQKNLLQEHGARYTILQSLPYWRPVEMMSIDVMHTCILGMLRDYSLTYLGLADVGQHITSYKFSQKTTKTSSKPMESGIKETKRKGREDEDSSNSSASYSEQRSKIRRKEKKTALSLQEMPSPSKSIESSPGKSVTELPSSSSIKLMRSSTQSHALRSQISTKSSSSECSSKQEVRRSPRLAAQVPAKKLREALLKQSVPIMKGKGKGKEEEVQSLSDDGQSSVSHMALESQKGSEMSDSSSTRSMFTGSSVQSTAETAKRIRQYSGMAFTIEELVLLHSKVEDVIVPSWVTRLPKDVGTAAAGTPKAAEWLNLFLVHFVLIVIPHWTKVKSEREKRLISTTVNLINTIRFFMSHSISKDNLTEATETLKTYRQNLKDYWGIAIQPKPTLHIAQHFEDVIKRFGPPSVYSAWAGERIIHLMTKIKKNKQSSKANFQLII